MASKYRVCTSLSNRLARCCAYAYVCGWEMWCMRMCVICGVCDVTYVCVWCGGTY